MRRFFLAIALFCCCLRGQAQCADAGILEILPANDSIPCAGRGAPYNLTITFGFDLSALFPYFAAILDSVGGMPEGISYTFDRVDPTYYNEEACVTFSGTTTAPAGRYPLYFYGTTYDTSLYPRPHDSLFTELIDRITPISMSFTGENTVVRPHIDVMEQDGVCDHALFSSVRSVQAQQHISAYPNPAQDVITIASGVAAQRLEIQLFDAFGRQVLQLIERDCAQYSLRTEQLPRGIYFCRLRADGGAAVTRKVVLN